MDEDIRSRVKELVMSYDEVGPGTSREDYIELLGPEETKQIQDYMCLPSTSGCALAIRGFWRILGLTDRRVKPPYILGKAIAWLVAIAKEREAWVEPGSGELPDVGDSVLVGGQLGADGGVEHVFTIVDVRETDQPYLVSIDGGQRDEKGQQQIQLKQRRWVLRNEVLWDVSSRGTDPGANASGGRKVKGWVDVEKLFAYEDNLH